METNSIKPSTIHVWVPGIGETGGIQHYSACLVKALVEIFPGVRIVVLAKNDTSVHEVGNDVEVHTFGHLNGVWRTLCFAIKGIWLGWTRKPSFILISHPHFAKAAWFVWPVPFLAVAHGIETWGCLHGLFRRALNGAKGLLPVSEFTRQVLIKEGGANPDKVIVVPDTMREDAFGPGPKPGYLLERHGLGNAQPVLLTVGRLAASEAYKGQDQVIAALALIRQNHPDVRYIIAGRGDDEPRLRQLARDCGQADAVIFAGFVPEQELADYYRLCDAYVMPSTGEGFGIVYLEALASGRPCVVGNEDASPEAIGNGRLGFAVNPRSPDDIAEAVENLLNRSHGKPWLHEPETLRSEIIALYGFTAFKRKLACALQKLLSSIQ